jgi:hypothetical protein
MCGQQRTRRRVQQLRAAEGNKRGSLTSLPEEVIKQLIADIHIYGSADRWALTTTDGRARMFRIGLVYMLCSRVVHFAALDCHSFGYVFHIQSGPHPCRHLCTFGAAAGDIRT